MGVRKVHLNSYDLKTKNGKYCRHVSELVFTCTDWASLVLLCCELPSYAQGLFG
jgi:hypothetical protein